MPHDIGNLARRLIAHAANEANRNPSEAEKAAGNYRMGHLRIQGLDITIENPKGSTRSGVGHDGKKWSVKLPEHYGYLKKSQGADGDHVDVYVGPHPLSREVFIVDQVDHKTKRFDEHKVLLGFDSEASAREAYHKAFSDGKAGERIGGVTRMSIDEFKHWLANGNTKMPLLKGEKNIGTNIRTEEGAGKPYRQALAIALNTAYGKKKRADGGEASINRDGKGNKVPVADPYPLPGSEYADWYKGPLNAGKKLYGDLSSGNWRNWKAQPRPSEEDEEEPASSAVNRAGKGDKLSKAKGGAIEAALRAARKPQKRADGGHVGPLPGSTPGRADAIHTSVEDGSYIVPAWLVSYLGQGNTQNGYLKLERMFPNSKRRAEGGLIAGSSVPHMSAPRLLGLPHPHLVNTAPHLAGVPRMRNEISMKHVGLPRMPGMPHLARGGVPVRLSDGEFSICPADVTKEGGGNLSAGHKKLDKWVTSKKAEAASWLKKLPGPVKS